MDLELLKKLAQLRDGEGERKPSDALLLLEALKQLAVENEEIKEEVEDMDTLIAQFEWTDVNFKYWLKVGEGEVDYGEGDIEDPGVTLKATAEIWTGLGSGELESTSAYMAGDLQIEGNLQDAIAYGELNGLVTDTLRELREE
jgi:putative sterol carrier protein